MMTLGTLLTFDLKMKTWFQTTSKHLKGRFEWMCSLVGLSHYFVSAPRPQSLFPQRSIHMLSSHFAFTIVVSTKVSSETGIVIQGYLGDWTFKILKFWKSGGHSKLRFLKWRVEISEIEMVMHNILKAKNQQQKHANFLLVSLVPQVEQGEHITHKSCHKSLW